jgi:hypothetical protein
LPLSNSEFKKTLKGCTKLSPVVKISTGWGSSSGKLVPGIKCFLINVCASLDVTPITKINESLKVNGHKGLKLADEEFKTFFNTCLRPTFG